MPSSVTTVCTLERAGLPESTRLAREPKLRLRCRGAPGYRTAVETYRRPVERFSARERANVRYPLETAGVQPSSAGSAQANTATAGQTSRLERVLFPEMEVPNVQLLERAGTFHCFRRLLYRRDWLHSSRRANVTRSTQAHRQDDSDKIYEGG